MSTPKQAIVDDLENVLIYARINLPEHEVLGDRIQAILNDVMLLDVQRHSVLTTHKTDKNRVYASVGGVA